MLAAFSPTPKRLANVSVKRVRTRNEKKTLDVDVEKQLSPTSITVFFFHLLLFVPTTFGAVEKRKKKMEGASADEKSHRSSTANQYYRFFLLLLFAPATFGAVEKRRPKEKRLMKQAWQKFPRCFPLPLSSR